MRAKSITDGHGNQHVVFKCSGCNEQHVIPVTGPKAWIFNGSLDKPTLRPSILARYHAWNEATEQYDLPESICHSFVTDGQIEFLSDCTHAHAGQTVPLADVEDP